MKNYICFILLLSVTKFSAAQDIIINGRNGNRLLTWNDFKGQPDYNVSHDALTYWNINYGLKNISLKGDTIKIGSFPVTLSFDENGSWIKPQKQTDRLLKHEQGHFDLGFLCQREIINVLNNTIFFKDSFNEKKYKLFFHHC